jgi:hypothetical protein
VYPAREVGAFLENGQLLNTWSKALILAIEFLAAGSDVTETSVVLVERVGFLERTAFGTGLVKLRSCFLLMYIILPVRV